MRRGPPAFAPAWARLAEAALRRAGEVAATSAARSGTSGLLKVEAYEVCGRHVPRLAARNEVFCDEHDVPF